MRVVLPRTGPPVAVPPFLAAVLLVDLVAAVGLAAAGLVLGATGAASPAWVPWALAAFGVLLALADLAAARMRPAGLTWRRRLGFLAMAAAVWRGGSLESRPLLAVGVVLYMGFVWVALLTGGRALSRAIASATGEDRPE